ncbi:heat shock transcription factor, X-linked-like [Pseudorca crassidens]|uniref:heat shock transcription factor, X-linked-like n=1 Tax=Pseudorca crassidens TaxID=82174 RepID=UPI00352DC1BF
MAADKKGPAAGRAPGFGKAPLPPDTAAPALGSGSCTPQSLALDQPVPAGHPDLRLLPGEAAFQDLTEEPLLKRPRTACEAVWEGSLLFHPFPRKLWTIVHSSRFASIGWNEDGTCIGVNRPLFQKEVLDRDGLDKVFKTERVESFIRQLNRYGFSKVYQDMHTSLCMTNLSTKERPAHVLSERDCPHLLVRMKPRVHTKPASGQVDGEPAAPGHLPAPSAAEPQDGLPPSPEHIQGTPSYPQLDHASALARTDSVAPAPPWTAAEPPTPDPNAQVLVPLVPVLAEVAQPAEVPWLCCSWPPAQMSPPWPVPGLAAAPPPSPQPSPPPRSSRGPRCCLLRILDARGGRQACRLPDLDPSAPEPLCCCCMGSRCFLEYPTPPGRPTEDPDQADPADTRRW